MISLKTNLALHRVLWIVGFLCGVLSSQSVESQTPLTFGIPKGLGHPDRTYIESLLQSGLTDLALQFVESKIGVRTDSSPGLTNEQTQWRILRAEVQVAQLTSDLPSFFEQPKQIDAKLASIEAALSQFPNDPRHPWLQFKAIWCRWFILRSTIASYLAAPTRKELQSWSLQRIREAIQSIDELVELVKQIPTRDLPQSKPDGLDATQFQVLLAEVYLLKCDLLALRATVYPVRSDDRISVGTQILSTMDEAEIRLPRESPGRNKLQLARASAQILLDQPKEAIKNIESLLAKPSHSNLIVQAAVVAAEAHRMLGQLDQSKKWIDKAGGWQSHPSLAIEHFSNLLANEKSDPQQVQTALEVKKQIRIQFGGYWESRADAILVSSTVASNKTSLTDPHPTNSLSSELLKSEVKQLMAANKWLEALEKLSQAESAAANQNANREALQLAIQSAALWGARKEYSTSASEFHRAALAYKSEPRAPDAAMNAVGMLQEQIKRLQTTLNSELSNKDLLEQSLLMRKQVLRDLAFVWPATKHATEASRLLEAACMSEDKVWEICDLWIGRLTRLPTDAPQEIRQSVATKALDWLALTLLLGTPSWLESDLLGVDFAQKFEERIDKLRSLANLDASMTERVEILGAAQRQVSWKSIPDWPLAYADVLEQSTNSASSNGSAIPLLGSFLACAWKYEQLLQSNRVVSKLDAFGQSVSQLRMQCTESELGQFGPLLARSLERRLKLYEIAKLTFDGETDQFKSELKELEQSTIRDPWWPFQAARLIQTEITGVEGALERYRKLAAGFRSGQEPWLECRARTVELLAKQGKREDAQKLADLVLASYPMIPDEWKQRLRLP